MPGLVNARTLSGHPPPGGSHCSLPETLPLPQIVQLVGSQPSALPSHSSHGSTTPSPQNGLTQFARQWPGEPFKASPSSHCSPIAGCVTPSPQYSGMQLSLQPSSKVRLPSSHCSPGALTAPSPHAGRAGQVTPAIVAHGYCWHVSSRTMRSAEAPTQVSMSLTIVIGWAHALVGSSGHTSHHEGFDAHLARSAVLLARALTMSLLVSSGHVAVEPGSRAASMHASIALSAASK